jgi:hypothetical protein
MTEIPRSALKLAKKVSVQKLRTIPQGSHTHWPGVVTIQCSSAVPDSTILTWTDDKLCPGIFQHYQGSESAILQTIQLMMLTPLSFSSPLQIPQICAYSGKSFISPYLDESNPDYQNFLNLYSFAALWEATLRDKVAVGFELEIKQGDVSDAISPFDPLTKYLNSMKKQRSDTLSAYSSTTWEFASQSYIAG